MTIIVGLGNPGKKYEKTRHNVGSRVIDGLKFLNLNEKKVLLVKPRTFMNQSGKAVKKLIENLKLKIENLIVVHDDIDLLLGKFKISKGRGSAGHKGVQSIIKELKTKDFWRVRIGICPKTGKPTEVDKFVLENFTKQEEKTLKEVIEEAIQTISNLN